MDRVGVRELRQNASRYLAIVAAGGGPIVITDRGRPVARLVGIGADPWTDLIDSYPTKRFLHPERRSDAG